MREPTEIQKQHYKRFTKILEMGKQRYTKAKGTAQGYKAGIKGQDYLTDEERQEASFLLRQMFIFPSNNTSTTSREKLQIKQQTETES